MYACGHIYLLLYYYTRCFKYVTNLHKHKVYAYMSLVFFHLHLFCFVFRHSHHFKKFFFLSTTLLFTGTLLLAAVITETCLVLFCCCTLTFFSLSHSDMNKLTKGHSSLSAWKKKKKKKVGEKISIAVRAHCSTACLRRTRVPKWGWQEIRQSAKCEPTGN